MKHTHILPILSIVNTTMSSTDVLKVSILGKDSIHCGFHLIPYIAHTVLSTLPASTYVVVTDTHIAKLYLDSFVSEFNDAIGKLPSETTRPRFLNHVVPPGETSKSREGKANIEDFLLLNRCTRDTVILALGGGVIGDLVGFVAATLWVHIYYFLIAYSHILQYARCTILPDPNYSVGNGRFQRRWKNGHRHTPWQKSHRGLLAARVYFHRCSVPRDTPRTRVFKWHG